MSPVKTLWFCAECGHESTGYLGKCPMCGVWDSFKEASFAKNKKSSKAGKQKSRDLFVKAESKIMGLSEIPENEISRLNSNSEEFNRVLGGGIVPGSLVLLGGEPGIGKSTLLLQTANNFSQQGLKVLYVSAEESSQQIKLRAKRLNIDTAKNKHEIQVYPENELNQIIATIENEEPNLVIVDSIQAVFLEELDSVPGSPSQIRGCCGNLMRSAKAFNIPIILVGHINKEGDLAGPKILEHMVDTVLQFEGKADNNIRFLRSIKNRFGSTNEVGLFSMEASGLHDLSNPSEIFLEQKSSGVIFASKEGKRSLLLEVQALVLKSDYNNPRRLANGIEPSRLHQILAVLEKKLGLKLSFADTYVNVVGGLQLKEPAADLAVALAIYKSVNEIDDADDIVACGEIGLDGELRSVTDILSRIKEAHRLGFKKMIIPEINYKKLSSEDLNSFKGLQLIKAKSFSKYLAKCP